jgi:hypothetical protein
MEGILAERALVNVLRSLQRERVTGILTVQGEEEIIAFSLLEGTVVSADALNQSLEDGLGEVLIKEGLIDAEDFAGLVAEYQAGGGRVTELLLERSYLTREQLLGALRRLTYRLSRQALTWKLGEYRFYQGDDVAYEAGVVPLGIDELLVRAADDLQTAGPFGSHVVQPEQLYAAVLETGSEDPLPNEVLEEGRPEAEKVYRALDGRLTVSRVAAEAGVSIHTVRALAAHWLQCGLIQASSPAPPPAAVEVEAIGPIADLGLDAILADPMDAKPLELESEADPVAEVVVPPPPPRKTISPWPSRAMGLALLGAALWVLVTFPGRLLLPFPWQGGLRDAFESERERLSVHKIDRAATTFFLLEGRYPEDLSLLVADRLLSPGAATDLSGRRFVFSAGPASYVVQRVSSEETVDAGWSSAIAGNFLLDPQFLAAETASEPPLVLLD